MLVGDDPSSDKLFGGLVFSDNSCFLFPSDEMQPHILAPEPMFPFKISFFQKKAQEGEWSFGKSNRSKFSALVFRLVGDLRLKT